MIMLTVTKPRRKLKRLLKAGALLLLLGVVVPGIYHSLTAAGAMSLFAASDAVVNEQPAPESNTLPEADAPAISEPTANAPENAAPPEADAAIITEPTANGPEDAAPLENDTPPEFDGDSSGLWQSLREAIFGEKAGIIPY